jgi:hypothetical protein
VVVRGGSTACRGKKVREVSEDTLADSGFYARSVFAALDGDVPGLCERVPRLRTPASIWEATCGQLRHGVLKILAELRPETFRRFQRICLTAFRRPSSGRR